MSSSTGASAPFGRFSTLKAFKFGIKEKDGKPPPPPPKDEYYLRNRSMASLSPDAISLPPHSPLSPRQNKMYTSQGSHDPNQSTMSLTSSIASGLSSPAPDTKRPQSRGKEKALAFLKFGRRSPRLPSHKTDGSVDDAEPPIPQEDPNISMPFNFQHNIHVDDGLNGLPPTWSTTLSQAGFSDEEIIAIQTRRAAGSRSPHSQYILNTRPPSPSIRHPYQSNYASPSGPVLAQPVPRTTSLPRQYSDASLKGGATLQKHPFAASASGSTTSLSSSKAGSINHRVVGSQDHSNRQHTPQLSVSYSSDSHQSGTNGNEDLYHTKRSGPSTDSTPARKPLHTTNGSVAHSVISQVSSHLNGHNRNESAASTSKRFFGSQPGPLPVPSSTTTQRRAGTDTVGDRNNPDGPKSQTTLPSLDRVPSRTKRTGALPPRLSLHQATGSGDLSAWLSGQFGDIEKAYSFNPTPITPLSAPASAATQTQARPPPRPTKSVDVSNTNTINVAGPSRAGNARRPDHKPIQARPEPLSELEEPTDSDAQYATLSPPWTGEQSSSSPLWSEIEGILGQVQSPPAREDIHESGPYSAALADNFSPTLPFSPEEDRIALERKLRNERSRERLDREEEDLNRLSVNTARPNRDSSRSSTSTISGLHAAPTIVRHVSVVGRVGAYVIDKSKPTSPVDQDPGSSNPIVPSEKTPPHRPSPINAGPLPSPRYSSFGSEESSASGSSSQSQDIYPTPTSANSTSSPLRYYLEPSPSPSQSSFSPSQSSFSAIQPRNKEYPAVPPAFNEEHEDDEDIDDDEGSHLIIPHHIITAPSPQANRPTIIINEVSPGGLSTGLPTGAPASPFQRYRGWLSEVVKPLEEYIDDGVDPRDHYLDLKEIAEGESGSVFCARLTPKDAHKLHLPPHVKARDSEDFGNDRTVLVAIKSVAIVPSGSPKLKDLQHELGLMKGLYHENIVGLDALYVDFLEDTLWIRMELMERSLADLIGLVDHGLVIQDRTIARFASDILSGLDYLQQHRIGHRDVRSDNLLINKEGVLKLTDFANAVQVAAENPMRSEPAGVLYWQAPEIRSPPYNALKVDVWSLGATVWELAETMPPFSDTNEFADRWPPLSQPALYSPAFHDFLRLCSEPEKSRPGAGELLKTPFVKNACGRAVTAQLVSQCMAIETALQG